MREDLVLIESGLRRDRDLEVALDMILAGKDGLAGRPQLDGALATKAFAAAGGGQNDAGAACSLDQCGALMDQNFFVIGLEDYMEMLHLRFTICDLRFGRGRSGGDSRNRKS
ncbi:MAG: hypothetical protein A2Y77_16610 [Planctomycetes bacterium RBG_13_62_9]|nr:MAG: hypothetical protein A2Y77_16610 [Planctomycetes bacterium RBG_13_62_9]